MKSDDTVFIASLSLVNYIINSKVFLLSELQFSSSIRLDTNELSMRLRRSRETTVGHCPLQCLGFFRKQPNAFAVFLTFLQRGDGGGGATLLLTVLKAQSRKLSGVRLPLIPFLKGESWVTVTVNISETPQAERSRRFAAFRRTRGVPRTVAFQDLMAVSHGKGFLLCVPS